MNKQRILYTLLSSIFVFFIYYLGGGDFERGESLAWTTCFSAVFGVWAYFCPEFPNNA